MVSQEVVTGVVREGRRFRLVRVFENRDRLQAFTLAEGQFRDNSYFYEYDGSYRDTEYDVLGFAEVTE